MATDQLFRDDQWYDLFTTEKLIKYNAEYTI